MAANLKLPDISQGTVEVLGGVDPDTVLCKSNLFHFVIPCNWKGSNKILHLRGFEQVQLDQFFASLDQFGEEFLITRKRQAWASLS
ncbi:MAG: hypothetical protein M0C28_33360 [Candidatus Moduliflexus flocculans]|nr:hypothetical protein [Candidatus Moduliflexus flocculans]